MPDDYNKKDSYFLATLYVEYERNASRILQELKSRKQLKLLDRIRDHG
jgi:hypothetical protein